MNERTKKQAFTKIRTIAAWATLVWFISFYIAREVLVSKYGASPKPDSWQRPTDFVWLLWWRNISYPIALLCGLISLPRWQSIIGLGLTLFFLYIFVTSY